MKKWLSLVLAAVLALALAVPALAEEPTVLSLENYKGSANLNIYCNTFAIRVKNTDYYCLLDADGKELVGITSHYTDMYPRDTFYKVEGPSDDGVHDEGVLDGYDGHVIVPAKYADIDFISDRWIGGIKLTSSNEDDKDYTFTFSGGEKKFYRIDTVDIYFDGTMVGTLTRNEYHGGYATAHGSYLTVTNMAKEYVAYNSKLEKSPITPDYASSEYISERRSDGTRYYHVGSGQEAFVPSCTLTADEVERPFNYVNGVAYDLQGNVLFTTVGEYSSLRTFKGGLAVVYKDSCYGMIDTSGNVVIPVEYKSLDDTPVYGYIYAEKDGKAGYLDVHGNVTCPFTYNADVVKHRGCFSLIQDLDGSYIVLSAAVGVLPERYASVDFPTYSGSMAFVGTNSNNELTIVDLYGNTLLPYTNEYRRIELSKDGSMAEVNSYENGYMILKFSGVGQSSQQQPLQNPGDQANALVSAILGQMGQGEQTADGSWTCPNGHSGNTGNFCTECGVPKPEEVKPAFCANCGYAFGDTVPNFCPNCGTATK